MEIDKNVVLRGEKKLREKEEQMALMIVESELGKESNKRHKTNKRNGEREGKKDGLIDRRTRNGQIDRLRSDRRTENSF